MSGSYIVVQNSYKEKVCHFFIVNVYMCGSVKLTKCTVTYSEPRCILPDLISTRTIIVIGIIYEFLNFQLAKSASIFKKLLETYMLLVPSFCRK